MAGLVHLKKISTRDAASVLLFLANFALETDIDNDRLSTGAKIESYQLSLLVDTQYYLSIFVSVVYKQHNTS